MYGIYWILPVEGYDQIVYLLNSSHVGFEISESFYCTQDRYKTVGLLWI